MCGISGLFNWEGITPSEISKVKHSLSEMKYRGPDFSGIHSDTYSVLGHNRLSILDLNPRSNQPMTTADGRYSIVFNGEIYNFKEIKEQLEQQGIIFHTSSDTEILLQGFVRYGDELMDKLRGMFAFVIWDTHKKEIFVARDRFGEKPLYYFYKEKKQFGFASNLSGIVALTDDELIINKQAICELLSQQYIDYTTCIYHGIEKLEPGCFMKITNSSCDATKYWSPNYKNKIEVGFEESKTEIHRLLNSAVEEQLVSDVPVGLFLSGGVDSCVIAALAAKNKKDITAITMSVPSNKNVDEGEAAAFVAQKLNVNHRIVALDYRCVNSLPFILKTIEPLADASLIPSMAIAKEAKNDFKVMLSGDGGDEVFGGYNRPINFNKYTFMGNDFTQRVIGKIIKNSDSFPYNYLSSKFNDARVFKWGGLKEYYNNKSLAVKQTKSLLKTGNIFKNKLLNHYQESEKYIEEEVDKLLYVGVKSNLVNDFLFKMDSANMFYSVESRAPFLDHRIIDFTSHLKINQLMPKGIDKELLKSIGENYLPKDFFNLPKKGFSIPYYEYLKTSWGDTLSVFIQEGISSDMDLLDPQSVLELLCQYRDHPSYKIGRILYSILVFEIWLRVFHLKFDPNEIKLN